jgi:hypothetical protein
MKNVRMTITIAITAAINPPHCKRPGDFKTLIYLPFISQRFFRLPVHKLTVIIAIIDNGKENTIGSIAYHGYFSIKISFPNSALHIPTGRASALCMNNITNIPDNAPTNKLAKAPSRVAFFQ